MKLGYLGAVSTIAGQVGTTSVYTASHNSNGYLVVTALTSGNSTTIPQFAKILAGTNFAATGLVITEPKLTQTPAHPITGAVSSTILGNAVTLTFTSTGYMNWIAGASVTISGVTPDSYNGTYTIASATNNTAFTVSKSYPGTNGAAGLPNATAYGTAVMAITNAITGLYATNLTSTINSANDITFTAPNLVPVGTQAISIFNSTTTPLDVQFYNRKSKLLETIALPNGVPTRLEYLTDGFRSAIYSSTAVAGTSFNKAIFWSVRQ